MLGFADSTQPTAIGDRTEMMKFVFGKF